LASHLPTLEAWYSFCEFDLEVLEPVTSWLFVEGQLTGIEALPKPTHEACRSVLGFLTQLLEDQKVVPVWVVPANRNPASKYRLRKAMRLSNPAGNVSGNLASGIENRVSIGFRTT
jgi:hypothetical protein